MISNPISAAGRWARRNVPVWRELNDVVAKLPKPLAALVTALGHIVLTAALAAPGLLLSPFLATAIAAAVATGYTVREYDVLIAGGLRDPLYDHVSDVAGPWMVVGFALALGVL